jgi:hypothetical protein
LQLRLLSQLQLRLLLLPQLQLLSPLLVFRLHPERSEGPQYLQLQLQLLLLLQLQLHLLLRLLLPVLRCHP